MGLLLFAIMNPLVIITLLEINPPPPSLLTPSLSLSQVSFASQGTTWPLILHIENNNSHLFIQTYTIQSSKPLYDYDSMTQFSTAQFITKHPFSPSSSSSSSSPSSSLLLQKPIQNHKKMCLTSHKIYFSMQHKQSKRCRIQVHRLAR